jgi:hypothetical protein
MRQIEMDKPEPNTPVFPQLQNLFENLEVLKQKEGGKKANDRDAVVFSGTINETVPIKLYLDSRLTPLERNAWVAYRVLMNKGGTGMPSYEKLRQYLSMETMGHQAGKSVVSKALFTLRLTGWMALLRKKRDSSTGQFKGNDYILNETPMSVAEILTLDPNFPEFVSKCLQSKNKSLSRVAKLTQKQIIKEHNHPSPLPTRADIYMKQALEASRQQSFEMEFFDEDESEELAPTAFESLGPESGLGEKSGKAPSPESGLGGKYQVLNQDSVGKEEKTPSPESGLGEKTPGLKSGLGEKPHKTVISEIPRSTTVQYSTSIYKNTSTSTFDSALRFPSCIQFKDAFERQSTERQLRELPLETAKNILEQTATRIQGKGGIKSHAAYIKGLIKRAKRGEFNPLYAASEEEKPPVITAEGRSLEPVAVSDSLGDIRQQIAAAKKRMHEVLSRSRN